MMINDCIKSINNSVQYYNKNARKFIEDTLNANMSEHYEVFLKHIPSAGKILDAGCGSGRDTKKFIELDYQVEAFDASEEMVKFATEYTGLIVKRCEFNDLNYEVGFDGIWACASLLHLYNENLTEVLNYFVSILNSKGAIYLSFKYGKELYEKDGRIFNCFTEETFTEYLKNFKALELDLMYVTYDVRPGRQDEKWLSIVLKRK